ncbi:unnamed protein product, partial [Symbiodinium microadriaticum]
MVPGTVMVGSLILPRAGGPGRVMRCGKIRKLGMAKFGGTGEAETNSPRPEPAWYRNQTNTQNWEWWPQAPRKVYKDTFKPTAAFHSVVASEWTRGTDTVSKAAVLKALSDGADFKGNLLILHSPEQICELRDLWKSLSCERSLTVVAPQTSTEVFEGTVAKVTVRRTKSATSLEHVVLWAPGVFFITGKNARSEAILWRDPSKDEGQAPYLRRIRTKAQERRQGVKFRAGGGKDLGLVKLPSDTPPQKPGVFQAT